MDLFSFSVCLHSTSSFASFSGSLRSLTAHLTFQVSPTFYWVIDLWVSFLIISFIHNYIVFSLPPLFKTIVCCLLRSLMFFFYHFFLPPFPSFFSFLSFAGTNYEVKNEGLNADHGRLSAAYCRHLRYWRDWHEIIIWLIWLCLTFIDRFGRNSV